MLIIFINIFFVLLASYLGDVCNMKYYFDKVIKFRNIINVPIYDLNFTNKY